MSSNVETQAIIRQKEICIKYGADFSSAPFDAIIGIALETFAVSKKPVNGFRHKTDNNSDGLGWYVWAGEYSLANDFFEPMHVEHLLEVFPKIVDYLGLAPGWRFLLDDSYEDVWYDENIL